MNELLQKHGCSNVFSIPDGLKELMSDISREVLREQPSDILEFITKYLSALIITREHGVMALRVLNDLCDCRPSLSEHLMQLGLDDDKAKDLATIISEEIEGFEPVDEKDKIKESRILERILVKIPLDEEMAAQVCEIARNAYRDYWYRKNKGKEKPLPTSPWEIAAQRTLDIYGSTKPTMEEMNRAAEKIQAAYKGYYVRKKLLRQQETSPKVSPLPIMTSGSRTIDFGPIVNIKVQEDNIEALFAEKDTHERTLCLCAPDDMEKIQNTPANASLSRRSETQELPSSDRAKHPGDVMDLMNLDMKDDFYLEATKKAIKNRDELTMSAPGPGFLANVTIGVDNLANDVRCECILSEDSFSEDNEEESYSEEQDSDVHNIDTE